MSTANIIVDLETISKEGLSGVLERRATVENDGSRRMPCPATELHSNVVHVPSQISWQATGIMDKEEWPRFMHTLREPLPACFRMHADCSFKEE